MSRTNDSSVYERTILPKGIEERLEKGDWTKEDVLVGSLSSVEQWNECLAKNYYYVPADSLSAGYHQVEFIAVYQSKKLFGEKAGAYTMEKWRRRALLREKRLIS